MSKERLEDIKVKVNNTIDTMLYVPYGDIKFLIEQAERVQELEETNKKNYWIAADFKFENLKLEQQNKRYREALEFYAEPENYCVTFEDDYEPILQDNGKTARQALGWEENK